MALTAEELAEAVIVNMEQRADLLAKLINSTDYAERTQLQVQIQATFARADDLATLQKLLSAVAALRSPPPPPPPADPDIVSNLQERAALLEQSAAAADKAARDQVQAQIELNAAKAADLAKLRSVQNSLDQLSKAAVALEPMVEAKP